MLERLQYGRNDLVQAEREYAAVGKSVEFWKVILRDLICRAAEFLVSDDPMRGERIVGNCANPQFAFVGQLFKRRSGSDQIVPTADIVGNGSPCMVHCRLSDEVGAGIFVGDLPGKQDGIHVVYRRPEFR